MSAATFAQRARTGPRPCATGHSNNLPTSYTCHMAAIHWAFMDLGDSQVQAHRRLDVLNRAKCPGCAIPGRAHVSIDYSWYGRQFCALGAVQIQNRAAVYGAAQIGDVLILPDPRGPMHSMVVVGKTKVFGRTWVNIRGFNNAGTFGPGSPYLAYDNTDRDIDKAKHWRTIGGTERFGLGGTNLFRIPYANYIAAATAIRNACNITAPVPVYTGP